MSPAAVWTLLIVGYVLPWVHITVARPAGGWRPPEGSKCPFGPRVGWLVMVLMLGPIGWLMFMRARSRRRSAGGG